MLIVKSIILIISYFIFSIFLIRKLGFRFSLLVFLPTTLIYIILPLTVYDLSILNENFDYLRVCRIIFLFFTPTIVYCCLFDRKKWINLVKDFEKYNYDNYRKILYNKYALTIFLGLLCIYLVGINYDVGIKNTGLFSLINDPANQAIQRELSAKLLSLPFLKRLQSILVSSLIPLYLILSTLSLRKNLLNLSKINKKDVLQILLILFLSLVYLLPGTRSGLANILFIVGLPIFLRSKSLLNSLILLFSFLTISFFSVIIFLFVKLQDTIIGRFDLLFSTVYMRIALTPLKVSSWWLDYYDQFGISGLRGIHKISLLLGLDYIDLPNQIGLQNVPSGLESISAVTNPAITFYTYFGIIGVFIGGVSLIILEKISLKALLISYASFRIPAITLLSLVSIKAIESDLLTLIFNHGYFIFIILCYASSKLFKKYQL